MDAGIMEMPVKVKWKGFSRLFCACLLEHPLFYNKKVKVKVFSRSCSLIKQISSKSGKSGGEKRLSTRCRACITNSGAGPATVQRSSGEGLAT